MKTFIRKWVLVSHFWQLAGEHLRSLVTFYSCPWSLWPVAPRTCVLLRVISYQWHCLWLLQRLLSLGGAGSLVIPRFPRKEQKTSFSRWTDLGSSADWSQTKYSPYFKEVHAALSHLLSSRSLVVTRLCSTVWGGMGLGTCYLHLRLRHWDHFFCSLAQNIALICDIYL